MESKKGKLTFAVVWIFLLCYFMMLFDFPNKLTILFGSIICLCLWKKQGKFRLDIGICLLTLTMASYHIIVYGTRAFTMSLPYVPLVIFVLGHYLACEVYCYKNREKAFIWLIMTIVVGYSIHGALNSYMYLSGEIADTGRHWLDFWLQVHLPGTWQCVYFLPALAYCFLAVIYWKRAKISNSIILVVSILFIYVSIASQSRMAIVIFVLTVFCQIVLYIILEYEKVKKIVKNRVTWVILFSAFFIMYVMLYFIKDHEIIKQFAASWGRSGGIFNNVRFKIQKSALQQIPLYPMGGNRMHLYGYAHAHNAWLSMADMAGWIPFGTFTIYTVITLIESICWTFKKEITTERKIMTVGLLITFFLFYMVERVFEGALHFLTPYIFINGLIHGEFSMMRKPRK